MSDHAMSQRQSTPRRATALVSPQRPHIPRPTRNRACARRCAPPLRTHPTPPSLHPSPSSLTLPLPRPTKIHHHKQKSPPLPSSARPHAPQLRTIPARKSPRPDRAGRLGPPRPADLLLLPTSRECDAASPAAATGGAVMVGFFRSGNLASRVFDRQFLSPRPGATVNTVRQFYENLVPSYTIYDIDCPDYSFRKFTDDGKYLVAFSPNHQDLIVYRPIWLTFSCNEDCDSHDLPPKAKKFDSFFKQLYSISLASSNEYICKDFFLYMECHQFGLFATSTAQSNDSSATEGAIHGVPSIEKITFYLVRLEDGVILDEKAFCNDFINLAHSIGAYLYEDLLCIVSLRYQTIHILQIRDSGNLVEVRRIGAFCQEDDELFLHSHGQAAQGGSFLPGIKQRLLSFIFHKTWNEEPDQSLRVQHLKKKFYFHFQDYVDLFIWKVQFLDRHHLFIKFGSVDGGVSRSTDQNLAFFAVYNMETTNIVSLYQNSSEELYSLFEHFYDHFHANPQHSSHGNFISSHSNNVHALDQLRTIKNKASSSSQFVKKMMASLPYTCQSQSPSPYFDLSLFRYDEKLISAIDRHRHCTEHPIKFISVRQPNVVKFKIKPGSDSGSSDSRAKRISSFLFHPFFPLALSIQQTYMQPTVVNVHLRR